MRTSRPGARATGSWTRCLRCSSVSAATSAAHRDAFTQPIEHHAVPPAGAGRTARHRGPHGDGLPLRAGPTGGHPRRGPHRESLLGRLGGRRRVLRSLGLPHHPHPARVEVRPPVSQDLLSPQDPADLPALLPHAVQRPRAAPGLRPHGGARARRQPPDLAVDPHQQPPRRAGGVQGLFHSLCRDEPLLVAGHRGAVLPGVAPGRGAPLQAAAAPADHPRPRRRPAAAPPDASQRRADADPVHPHALSPRRPPGGSDDRPRDR